MGRIDPPRLPTQKKTLSLKRERVCDVRLHRAVRARAQAITRTSGILLVELNGYITNGVSLVQTNKTQ